MNKSEQEINDMIDLLTKRSETIEDPTEKSEIEAITKILLHKSRIEDFTLEKPFLQMAANRANEWLKGKRPDVTLFV